MSARTQMVLAAEKAASGYSTEAAAFFARITDPGTTRKDLYAALIDSLVSGGVWAKLDLLHIFAADIEANARINLVNSSFSCSNVDVPSFTADRGFTTDGTNDALDTGYTPSSSAINLTQNKGSIGIWIRSVGGTTVAGNFGTHDTLTNAISINPRDGGIHMTSRTNSSNLASSTVAGSTPFGFSVGVRQNDASNVRLFKDGAFEASIAAASTGLASSSTYYGRANSIFCNRQFCAGFIGSDLSDANVTTFYNALATYMTAVGA